MEKQQKKEMLEEEKKKKLEDEKALVERLGKDKWKYVCFRLHEILK